MNFAFLFRRIPVGGFAGGSDPWSPGTARKPSFAAAFAFVKFDQIHAGRACYGNLMAAARALDGGDSFRPTCRTDAFVDFKSATARDERCRRVLEKVVEIGARRAPQLKQVAETAGRY